MKYQHDRMKDENKGLVKEVFTKKVLLVGLSLGLVLALGMYLWLVKVDAEIRREYPIEQSFGLPVDMDLSDLERAGAVKIEQVGSHDQNVYERFRRAVNISSGAPLGKYHFHPEAATATEKLQHSNGYRFYQATLWGGDLQGE